MDHATRTLALGLALLSPCLSAQGGTIAVLEGAHRQSLTLRLFDENDLTRPPQVFLSQLEFLPIERTNRTAQMEFVPGRSHLRSRQGLTFLALPDGGKLFKFVDRSAATRFGYLLIRPDGNPRLILRLPGIGTGGNGDPFADRIGIAPDGRHASLTTLAGALWIARLDGQDFASTQAPSRPLTVPPGVDLETPSLVVGPSHLFFVTGDDRIRRCALADGNQPVDVTPPHPSGSRLKEEVAPSTNGDAVAFLLGPKDFYSIFLLRSTGPAVRLPLPAAKYEEPGYLPEFRGGPRMLLNDDSSRLLYVDSTSRDEIFVTDTAGSSGTTHITSDANFEPYIGVGIFPAFLAQTVVMAVGDPSAVDWIAASTSNRSVVNLTRTGRNPSPPFAPGTLDPVLAFPALDGAVIAAESKAGTTRLRRIDPRAGTSAFIGGPLRGTPELGMAAGGQPSVLVPSITGDLHLGFQPSAPTIQGPPGLHLSPEVVGPPGTYGVFTVTDPVAKITLPIIHIYGGILLLGPRHPGLRQVCVTAKDGALLNGTRLRYLAPGVDAILPGTPALRIVLSGATQ